MSFKKQVAGMLNSLNDKEIELLCKRFNVKTREELIALTDGPLSTYPLASLSNISDALKQNPK